MPQQPEFVFNERETELMFSRELFPLKRQINHKLYILFEQVKQQLKDSPIHQNFTFPESTDRLTGKISQGENHGGFPWVMLDFPKLFQQHRIFAYRTMFWYGNGFSNSLLAGGDCCEIYRHNLLKNLPGLSGQNIFFSFSKDPWNHEVGGSDSALIETLTRNEIEAHINLHGFFKLSNAFKSGDGNWVMEMSLRNYGIMLGAIS